jgi:hypothetical protein
MAEEQKKLASVKNEVNISSSLISESTLKTIVQQDHQNTA